MRETLSQVIKKELFTVPECIKKLGWKTEFDFDKDNKTGKITCDCGGTIKTGGWIGTEYAWCAKCGKGMQDMTGILPSSPSTVTMFESEKVEMPKDGRVWLPENVWGYKS